MGKIRKVHGFIFALAFVSFTVFIGQGCTDQNLVNSGLLKTASGGSVDNSGSLEHAVPPPLYNLGLNLSGIAYWNNVAVFSDMAMAANGNNGRWDGGNSEAPLDSGGNPTAPSWTGITADYASGNYAVSWDGTGTLTSNTDTMGPVTVTQNNGVQHNSATLVHVQKRNAWITFNTTPPITNIHIVAPASETYPGSYFMKDYITRIRGFSTLRFMDALNIDNPSVKNWSERTWPNEGSRAAQGGFAYEDIIALANLLGKDIWINVPGYATDDYVCRMARLFKYGEPGDKSNAPCNPTAPSSAPAGAIALNPNSRIYLEYSNEVWGGIWVNRQLIQDMADGKTVTPSVIAQQALANSSLPWPSDPTQKMLGLTKILEKRSSDIFKNVFGSRKAQVKFIFNVQCVWPDGATPGFNFITAAYGPVSNFADYFAVAPYFDVTDDSFTASVNSIFANFTNPVLDFNPSTGSSIASYLKADLNMANLHNLPVIAYEGGQGLAGASNLASKTAAQTDPRMYTMYQRYYSIWDQVIGKDHLFNHYGYIGGSSQWGSWGLIENGEDMGSQKWDALMSLARIPGDANQDGVVNDSDCAIVKANMGRTGMWWMQGDFNHDGRVDAADMAIVNKYTSGSLCQ